MLPPSICKRHKLVYLNMSQQKTTLPGQASSCNYGTNPAPAPRLWGTPGCWAALLWGSSSPWAHRADHHHGGLEGLRRGKGVGIQNTGSDGALWLFQHLAREYFEIVEAVLFAVPKGQGPVIFLTATWDRCLILSSLTIPLTTVSLFAWLDACLSTFLSLISSDRSLKWWH